MYLQYHDEIAIMEREFKATILVIIVGHAESLFSHEITPCFPI